MLKLGARFTINDKTQFDLPSPTETSVKGSKDALILAFDHYELSFVFAEAKPLPISKTWKVLSVTLSVNQDGEKKNATLSDGDGVGSIVARNSNSWACDHHMDFLLSGAFNVTIRTHDLRIEPYVKNNEFGLMERCEADEITNNVVPIAVGAALAILVVIVLALYLIGRRKHQRGYQTV